MIHIDAAAQWITQESGVTERLWDVVFIDEMFGWAVGDNFKGHRDRGVIVSTTGGGRNWDLNFELVNDAEMPWQVFGAISFYNRDLGFALAAPYRDNLDATYVYRTKNGGESWGKDRDADI